MNLSIILLLIFNLIPAWSAKARIWPGFRGVGDSQTHAQKLPLAWDDHKNVAWSIASPGYGQSSPVVWQQRIFLTSIEGLNKERLLVTSFDLKTGRQLWQKESPATFTMKDANIVSKAAPTPAVDEHRVYTFFESGDLLAFSHQGQLIWQRKLAQEYGAYKTNHGLGSSIALTDKAVIVLVAHDGPSYLLAVDKQTGQNLWKADRPPGGGWSSPIVANYQGQSQILISISGGVSAYRAETGEVLWSVKGLKGNNVPSPSVSLDQNLVVAGSSDKGMNVAIKLGGTGDVTESNIAWRAQEATANFSSPLIHQDHVYFVNKVGVAFCLDLKTGEERWRSRLGSECWASPLAADDHIYFFANDGRTFVLRAGAKLEQVAVNTLSGFERVYGVAAVDGALLLRSGRRLVKLGTL